MPALDALDAVNERSRRYLAASGCLGKADYRPDPAVGGWSFKQWTHPLSGWPMAYGYGPATPRTSPRAPRTRALPSARCAPAPPPPPSR